MKKYHQIITLQLAQNFAPKCRQQASYIPFTKKPLSDSNSIFFYETHEEKDFFLFHTNVENVDISRHHNGKSESDLLITTLEKFIVSFAYKTLLCVVIINSLAYFSSSRR